ncbi:MAG: response regulator, partial [Geminicoccaceae bacterium]
MSPSSPPKTSPNLAPVEILVVDDDESDVFLTERAFKKLTFPNRLTVARDGEEALAILRREGPHEAVPRPDLILLDINMPRMTGHELLEIVKVDVDLQSIPVIVMTMSQSDTDMKKSYQAHANSFISKPIELEEFTAMIQTI